MAANKPHGGQDRRPYLLNGSEHHAVASIQARLTAGPIAVRLSLGEITLMSLATMTVPVTADSKPLPTLSDDMQPTPLSAEPTDERLATAIAVGWPGAFALTSGHIVHALSRVLWES